MSKPNISLPPQKDSPDFDGWLIQVTQYLRDYLGVTDWTAVTVFSNSWINYGGAEQAAEYCKDGMGFVHLRGIIKSGTVDSSAFTLPAGYVPQAMVRFSVISNSAIGYVGILASGEVRPYAPSDNTWVSLDGITFYAG